jgi:hypothetical protein
MHLTALAQAFEQNYLLGNNAAARKLERKEKGIQPSGTAYSL